MKILFLLLFISSQHCFFAQKKWQPYGAAHISMDAAADYIGPSVTVGYNYTIKKAKVGVGINYFAAAFGSSYYQTNGKLRMITANFFIQHYLFKRNLTKLYVAGGFGYQYYKDVYKFLTEVEITAINYPVANYTIGYTFSKLTSKKAQLHLEFCGTSPFFPPKDSYQYAFAISQLSLGLKCTL